MDFLLDPVNFIQLIGWVFTAAGIIGHVNTRLALMEAKFEWLHQAQQDMSSDLHEIRKDVKLLLTKMPNDNNR